VVAVSGHDSFDVIMVPKHMSIAAINAQARASGVNNDAILNKEKRAHMVEVNDPGTAKVRRDGGTDN